MHFTIPKSNGTPRDIYSPNRTLRIIQKWILENILYKISVSDRAMAFVRKTTDITLKPRGCKKNALYHGGSLYSLHLDIVRFYDYIDSWKVYHLFQSMGYNETVSMLLTNLCTLDKHLPQGAITSPALANLVFLKIDDEISKFADKLGVRYSRYADDLFLSCDNPTDLRKVHYKVFDILLR